MIALISFKDNLVLTREEAERLKVAYKEAVRVGINSEGRLEELAYYEYFRDEVEKRDNKYYKGDKEVSTWNIKDRPKEVKDWVSVVRENQLVDLEEFILECRHRFYVEKAIKSEEPTAENIQSILRTVGEKVTKLNKTVDLMTEQCFNQKVSVHVGGGLIVTYNELRLKEDCCTDELQSELNNGWRIIAVCVQPDQRRPDYILGRYSPQLDVKEKPRADR